ncbi:GNAT family N-acetyltransferase [Burkholderia oklahomensis]|uniref:Acetyltransferase family protein n=1 Tax=Burkholderia oklahomensis TaxID=342113 RepID=A0AAI8FPC8_9BURK|nr:GNAT family protein [Burkholderia oklahomensis]AIO68491.1 acetyltransferase family protein [Burkholderia oklahomensis]AOI39014.1 acetyltransferase [Burkholderia oklahomensis EO147]KUY59486.1 acetyltransferase [Burkholderia oklahomensis EO147]QPS40636.1 GNAT family N-acetyltransferase [Burkholderia oklahomensis]
MSDSAFINEFGQPIGAPVPDWQPRSAPPRTPMQGRFCRVEPVDVSRHADDLYAAYASAADGRDWTYMSAGPFADAARYRAYLAKAAEIDDPLHHAIVDLATGKAVGTCALMRTDRANGVTEVGFVAYSPLLQKTCAGTEVMFLLMQRVFDELGYRRFEWKCDSLNAPSRAAALRYGFTYEGLFRQAVVYKGRSRDTAWYSVVDHEWPVLRSAFRRWLAAENFDERGRQRQPLAALIAASRGSDA